MALRLRKLVLGAAILPKHPQYFRHAVRTHDVVHKFPSGASNWDAHAVRLRRKDVVSRLSPTASSSSSPIWSRPGGPIVHSGSIFCIFGGRTSASASSGDAFVTTEGDGDVDVASVSSFVERDEETVAAIRGFDVVNEDLEAESQRNADIVRSGRRQKKMCYYFTQGLCTLVCSVFSLATLPV